MNATLYEHRKGILRKLNSTYRTSVIVLALISLGGSLLQAQAQAQRDYFLEALSNGVRECISPDGGMLAVQPEHTVLKYWNIPKVVQPGQIVPCAIGYTWLVNIGAGSIVYKTVLAEWQTNPCTPIAVLENGVLQGSPREIRHDFSFTAPTTPGTYRLRLAMTWAYQGIQCFYGDGPAGDVNHPGVGSYCEVQLRVQSPPQRDYFLEALSNRVRECISPDGGMLAMQPEHTLLEYWNIPKVVQPGQTVPCAIGYTWLTNIGAGSIVYKTVLAEWQTNSPIAVLENGVLQGSPREVRHDFSFTAPTTPGTYRLRLAMTWAYQGIQHFYGDGPAGDVNNPGVGHGAEVVFTVNQAGTGSQGGLVAYVRSDDNTLWWFDTATQQSHQVPLPGTVHAWSARWTPDGAWIVFHGGQGGNTQIYAVRPDGSGLRRITDGTGNYGDPAVCRVDSRIACWQVYGDVFSINFDGTGLTNLGYGIVMPDWSPDCNKLVGTDYIRGGGYNSDLWVWDLATGAKTNRITSRPAGTAYGRSAWSPDGSKIAAVFSQNGQTDIVLMNPDGSGIVNLTADWASSEDYPAWSPDGQYLLFASNHEGSWDVWVMRPNGSGRTKLISGGGAVLISPAMGVRDSDGDGLPDWWEIEHFGNLAQTGGADPDGDGYTNLQEYQNGTDPTVFDIGPMSIWTAVEVGWRSVAGTNYQVQWASALATNQWYNLGSPITGNGSTKTIFDSCRGQPQKFYRVMLAP
jgi:WD40 repeat protein